jgi:hypothetical protein
MEQPFGNVERVETIKQTAKRGGISERQVRHLIATGQLDHVMIGCRILIPVDAWPRFIATARAKSWHDETRGRDCGTSKNEVAITSPGQSMAAVASAQQVRRTAAKLKTSSRNGCTAEDAAPGQVIPLRS